MKDPIVLAALVWLILPFPAESQQTTSNRDRRLVTAEEIAGAQADNAYQAVETLRPEYFRRAERPQSVHGGERMTSRSGSPRNLSAASAFVPNAAAVGLRVFLDGSEVGDAQQLRQIPAHLVAEIRYLSGSEAQIELGPRYAGGILRVSLRR
jgi:hypothetical protein